MWYAGENGRSEAVGGNTPETAGNNEMCNCNAKRKIIKYLGFSYLQQGTESLYCKERHGNNDWFSHYLC